jgi:hypothetical protein
MRDGKEDQERNDESLNDLSRRDFVALSLAAGLGAATSSRRRTARATRSFSPDDRFLSRGADLAGFKWPASRVAGAGKRLAAEGYSVLVPNHLYRTARAPVFDESFDPVKNPADREKYHRTVAPFFAPGPAERDAVAYIAFLDAQRQVDKTKKIGTHGYCLGGGFVMKTAAALPNRIGAGPSFHGGFPVTDKPDSICWRRRSRHACILRSHQMTTSG